MNLPDRFDMYSVGIIFLQMVFPNLRTDSPLIQFNRQLKRCEYDLAKWREVQEGRALSDAQLKAFAMLDADGGHGWSLLQSLVNVKPGRRISAAGALAHPFFYPGDVPLLQQLRLGFVRFLYRDNTELSEAFGTFMSKAGTDEAGGFTEASLMEFKCAPSFTHHPVCSFLHPPSNLHPLAPTLQYFCLLISPPTP
ncbi:unnamed protein product [Closterium sp. Naga37s-1]|nr:unnamed protein product [Closterium sp. Naga37s-1]